MRLALAVASVALATGVQSSAAIHIPWSTQTPACVTTATRGNAVKADGDLLHLDASSTAMSTGCSGAVKGSAATSLPPTLITSTDACDPTRSSSQATMVAGCVGLAATQIATCDPILGYRYQATMIQTLRPDGTYTNPVLNSVITCNTPDLIPIVLTEADFRTLPLTPSAIVVGPPQGWIPVNMTTVVYTNPQPQTLTTTLLGQPVTVRATPTQFTWNWADGSTPTTTTDPGQPRPNHTLAHDYTRTGTYTVTMTTTWTGEYSLDNGTTYTPITGTATTTSTAPPLTVRELRTHLVEDLIG